MSVRDVSLTYPVRRKSPRPARRIEVAPGIHWLSHAAAVPARPHQPVAARGRDGGMAAGRWSTRASATPRRARCGSGSSQRRKPVTRVIVTHYHPDHAGNAAWLCQRFGAADVDDAGRIPHGARGAHLERGLHHRRRARGVPRATACDEERAARMARSAATTATPRWCRSFRCPTAASSRATTVAIGSHDWRAIIGHGHAPEHLSLYCEEPERGDRGRHAALDHLHQRERLVDRSRGRSAAPVPRFDRALSRAAATTCWSCLRTASRSAARIRASRSWRSTTPTRFAELM